MATRKVWRDTWQSQIGAYIPVEEIPVKHVPDTKGYMQTEDLTSGNETREFITSESRLASGQPATMITLQEPRPTHISKHTSTTEVIATGVTSCPGRHFESVSTPGVEQCGSGDNGVNSTTDLETTGEQIAPQVVQNQLDKKRVGECSNSPRTTTTNIHVANDMVPISRISPNQTSRASDVSSLQPYIRDSPAQTTSIPMCQCTIHPGPIRNTQRCHNSSCFEKYENPSAKPAIAGYPATPERKLSSPRTSASKRLSRHPPTNSRPVPAHLGSLYTKVAVLRHSAQTKESKVYPKQTIKEATRSAKRRSTNASIDQETVCDIATDTLTKIIGTEESSIYAKKTSTNADPARTSPVPLIENSSIGNDPKSSNLGETKSSPDARWEAPLETWTRQDWNTTRRARPIRKSWESETQDSKASSGKGERSFTEPGSSLHRYISWWVSRTPQFEGNALHDIRTAGVRENHDINPETGCFISPIGTPNVIRNPSDANNPSLADRLNKRSDPVCIDGRMKIMQKDTTGEGYPEQKREHGNMLLGMANAEATKGNRFLCRIPAHLRPAKDADMREVAQIYNREVKAGYRVLDREPVSFASFSYHLRYCQEEQIPFIVAMSEYRNPNMPLEEADHRVIGFAFFDIASRGIFGSTKSTGNQSAKLHIVVDPSYRRSRVASALLDRVLMMASQDYVAKAPSYQWVDSQNDPVYNKQGGNPRKWCTVQMEVLIENHGSLRNTALGQEYQFIHNWLELEYDFAIIHHTKNYAICGRHEQMFLDRLLLEHQCRDTDAHRHLSD